MRLGCALALLVTAACVGLFLLGLSAVNDRPVGARDFSFLEFAVIGFPFAMLALAQAREWLAWLVAVALTAAVWGWLLYEISLHRGANFAAGPILMIAPILIAGFSLAVAGLRGRIPWALDRDEA